MANNETINSIQGFDTLGKLIYNKTNTNSSNYSLNATIESGTILIFKVGLANGQTLTKKFIKL